MSKLTLTTNHLCPHCGTMTPCLHLTNGNGRVYLCTICLKDPTGHKPDIAPVIAECYGLAVDLESKSTKLLV